MAPAFIACTASAMSPWHSPTTITGSAILRAFSSLGTVRPSASGGWVIQLAAMDDETKARTLLKEAKAETRALAKADPYTEKVAKGGSTLWRARFAGFDEDGAQGACKVLKRGGYACYATKG